MLSKVLCFTTSFDQLNNIRSEYNRVCLPYVKVSNTLVARTHFGQDKASKTMSILSSLATTLPNSVLDTLGEVINSEHVDLSRKKDSSSLAFRDSHTENEGKNTFTVAYIVISLSIIRYMTQWHS